MTKVIPASVLIAIIGSLGMIAGTVVDEWQRNLVSGAHAIHAASHAGTYSWTLMILPCWITGWMVMSRTPGRVLCLATSTAIMIAISMALAWAGGHASSAVSTHAVMLATMIVSHECGVRMTRRIIA